MDVCVITKDKTDMLRNYVKPNERAQKEQRYGFKRGTTAWTKEKIWDLVVKDGECCYMQAFKASRAAAWTLLTPTLRPRPRPDILDLTPAEAAPADRMDTT